MKIFFTGATGFLGEKLALALLRDGHEVSALARQPDKVSAELRSFPLLRIVQGDLFDAQILKAQASTCDAVFHVAGLISYKTKDRAELERVNVQGTQMMLAACPRNLPFYFTSSVVAVGAGLEPETLMNEKSNYNLAKLNLGYYETKRKAETLVRKAHDRGLVRALIYNPSSTFGAGDVKKGSRSIHVKIAKGKLRVYCAGGVSIVHIDDCVQAMMTGFKKQIFGERFILSGDNLTILQMNQMIARLAGKQTKFFEIPQFLLRMLGMKSDRLMSMTLYHWYDHSKASAQLNFKPRPAEQAFSDSLSWAKTHGYLS